MSDDILREIERQITHLDLRQNWLEIGCLLNRVDEEQLYMLGKHNSFAVWMKFCLPKPSQARRIHDVYRRIVKDHEIPAEELEGIPISNIHEILSIWAKVPNGEISKLLMLLKSASLKECKHWRDQQHDRLHADVRELENMIGPKREPEIRLHKDLLGEGITLFGKNWRLDKQSGEVDRIGRSEAGVLFLVEFKKNVVDSKDVGQILGYRNYVRERKDRSEPITFKTGKHQKAPKEYDLERFASVEGILIGITFRLSAYFAGKDTGLKLYRVDKQSKRIVASIHMEKPFQDQWDVFFRHNGPERKDLGPQ